MENKKVKNTSPTEYNNIKFRSKLEVTCYKRLLEAGFEPTYESLTFTLLPKFNLSSVMYYAPYKRKGTKTFEVYPRGIMAMTYTPDFSFEYEGYTIIFDTKGQPNDTYPLKKKLFLWQLEQDALVTGKKYIFFEPHSQGQIIDSITVIKKLKDEKN